MLVLWIKMKVRWTTVNMEWMFSPSLLFLWLLNKYDWWRLWVVNILHEEERCIAQICERYLGTHCPHGGQWVPNACSVDAQCLFSRCPMLVLVDNSRCSIFLWSQSRCRRVCNPHPYILIGRRIAWYAPVAWQEFQLLMFVTIVLSLIYFLSIFIRY